MHHQQQDTTTYVEAGRVGSGEELHQMGEEWRDANVRISEFFRNSDKVNNT